MRRFTVAGLCSVVLFSVATSGPPARAQAQGQFAYCKADMARLCRGVQPGGGRVLGCLKAHENDLTVGCAKELKNLKARTGK
jgi:Cysteine rich repeat